MRAIASQHLVFDSVELATRVFVGHTRRDQPTILSGCWSHANHFCDIEDQHIHIVDKFRHGFTVSDGLWFNCLLVLLNQSPENAIPYASRDGKGRNSQNTKTEACN